MKSILRTSGIVSLVACAVTLAVPEAQAGWRRNCHCQPSYQTAYAAPAMTYSNAPVVADTAVNPDGRQRYQSAYQAPAPVNNTYAPVYAAPARVYYGPSYDNSNAIDAYRPLHFEDRTFQQQTSANRKIRGL